MCERTALRLNASPFAGLRCGFRSSLAVQQLRILDPQLRVAGAVLQSSADRGMGDADAEGGAHAGKGFEGFGGVIHEVQGGCRAQNFSGACEAEDDAFGCRDLDSSRQHDEQRAMPFGQVAGLQGLAGCQQDPLGFGAQRGQEVSLTALELSSSFKEGQYPPPGGFLSQGARLRLQPENLLVPGTP